MTAPLHVRRSDLRSFSLLEMILVLLLIALLTEIGLSGYSALMQSIAIDTGADMIRDVLVEGRSDAVSRNITVEVRIYDLPRQQGGAPVYDALQLHSLNPNGTTPPIANPIVLSSWIVIDATPAHSPLIAANPETAEADAADNRLNGQTRVFHFLPDGSTDLNPATNWFMTVRAATKSDPAQFPSNWACVAIDATTGRPQIYRP